MKVRVTLDEEASVYDVEQTIERTFGVFYTVKADEPGDAVGLSFIIEDDDDLLFEDYHKLEGLSVQEVEEVWD